MSEINVINQSNTEIIRTRMKIARAYLKEKKGFDVNKFASEVIEFYPEFDNVQGVSTIQRAWYGQNPNIIIMELAEKLVNEFENEKA